MQQNVTRSEPWDQTKLTNRISGVMGKRAPLECYIDRGFIGGVMGKRAPLKYCRSWVHRWCNG